MVHHTTISHTKIEEDIKESKRALSYMDRCCLLFCCACCCDFDADKNRDKTRKQRIAAYVLGALLEIRG